MTLATASLHSMPEPLPASRRGVCPTLAAPMQTGDGLLARLRPLDNAMTATQLRLLADAAAEFGNGIVEITARGSLQVRGLEQDTVKPFERAVVGSDLDIPGGVGVETPPLAGRDPDEIIDVRPLASEIRRRIEEHVPPLLLAPKLAITVDGGGRFHLGSVSADLRVTAISDGKSLKFILSLGGDANGARPVAIASESDVVTSVLAVLEVIARLGPSARGKTVAASDLGALYNAEASSGASRTERTPAAGIQDLGDGHFALGLAFPYCQAETAMLIGLADAMEELDASHIRLAPDHCLFVTGLDRISADILKARATELGFWTEPDDPRRTISLCAGARGCASAFYETRGFAERIQAFAPDLMDGSIDIHLSGCAKGCAHPAAAPITFAGARAGYGLVVNGAASASPALYVAENDIEVALKRLQALLRQRKEDGETVATCLTRLGGAEIADALQLDRT